MRLIDKQDVEILFLAGSVSVLRFRQISRPNHIAFVDPAYSLERVAQCISKRGHRFDEPDVEVGIIGVVPKHFQQVHRQNRLTRSRHPLHYDWLRLRQAIFDRFHDAVKGNPLIDRKTLERRILEHLGFFDLVDGVVGELHFPELSPEVVEHLRVLIF